MKLKEPLFLDVAFNNIKKVDKKPPSISVRVNLQSDDVIYVANKKSRMEVIGYEDSKTNLFITDVDGVDGPNVYNRFRIEAVNFAKAKLDKFIERLSAMSQEDYETHGYKDLPALTNLLYRCLDDRQEFYFDLQKQVSLIASRKLPRVNEYLIFEDDKEVLFPVTARLPYLNPKNQTLTEEDRELVDNFLDVFMDEYNKYTLSWYLGAALLNIDIHDDRVSKLAIVSSSVGGSGKSSLINGLADALFTPNFREIKDDFDSFFYASSQFGVSALSTKRISIYSEAKFSNHVPKADEQQRHDFTGMNVSVIKSLITEGYVSSEAKYGDRAMERLNGFHLVLTNHPPVINEEHEAMARRILPMMIYPSRMADKAKKLNLYGRQIFTAFLNKHRQAFANYFVEQFRKDEYAFVNVDYDHTEYTADITASQTDYLREVDISEKQLKEISNHGIIKTLEAFGQQESINITPFIRDVKSVMGGGGSEELREHIRLDDGTLYIDGSKNFLLRYGNYAPQLRKLLRDIYGEPLRKFGKRMFTIKITI